MTEPKMKRTTWEEFYQSGMLWWINTMLHIFGWSIVVETNREDEAVDAWPSRTEWRGFPKVTNDTNYERIDRFLHERFGGDLHELRKWAKARLDMIEADDRFQAEPALVQVNAGLALVQVQMKAERGILKVILEGVPHEQPEGSEVRGS